MIVLHGRATSSNVQPVVWLLAELGLDYRRLDVGGSFGGTDTPDYRAKNPMGLVPVMEDGDLILFESQAILRYLASRYGPALFPEDPAARARTDQWMEWVKTSVAPHLIYKVFWQLVRTPASQRDDTALQAGIDSLHQVMAIADERLSQHDWLAGSALSLADFSFGTQLYRYFTLPFERGNFPAVARYYARMRERPAYSEHVMVSYESLRAPGA